jgi:hypothetical protein
VRPFSVCERGTRSVRRCRPSWARATRTTIRTSLPRVFVAGLAVVIGIGALSACSVTATSYGCSDRDEQFAPKLATLSIFAVYPNHGVELDSYSGCDPDDGFAYPGKKYLVPLDRAAVLDFYRAAAAKEGLALRQRPGIARRWPGPGDERRG